MISYAIPTTPSGYGVGLGVPVQPVPPVTPREADPNFWLTGQQPARATEQARLALPLDPARGRTLDILV